MNLQLIQNVVFYLPTRLDAHFPRGLLSGHGREVVVGGESLDRFRCPAPSDCRPGTAPQVWSCCTLANPLARRRGPRWSPRRPAQGAAAVRCVLCARLQLLHFLLKRECSDLVRDDGEYAAAVEGGALCSGRTDGWDRHSAVQNTRHRGRALLSTTPIWMASILLNFVVK